MARPSRTSLTCLCCGNGMENFGAPDEGYQPLGGLAFRTEGHYGSAYFDGQPGFLEICICDPCVEKAEGEGKVFRGVQRPRRPLTDGEAATSSALSRMDRDALLDDLERLLVKADRSPDT